MFVNVVEQLAIELKSFDREDRQAEDEDAAGWRRRLIGRTGGSEIEL